MAYTCVTTDPKAFPGDRILLFGPDLPEISCDVPFARITLVGLAEDPKDEKAAYRTVREIELEKYRIESNSVLSFAKLYCVAEEEGVTVRDDLFLRYKEYCGNAGMKPVSQTNFNKELEAGFPEITRGRDKLSKRRIWRGITYCEGGVEAD